MQPSPEPGRLTIWCGRHSDKVVADATQQDWGADEIIIAIADNAFKLKEVNVRGLDPAEDPAINIVPANGR